MKIVKITWVDASKHYTGWTDELPPDEYSLVKIVSVGILIRKTREFFMISMSLGTNDKYDDLFVIPRKIIKSVEYL